MHHPKPKSAPARLKSKFVKNRTNAMKEIEAWVCKEGEAFPVPEASRMSGQLTDNVTEERMLKAKLWELSKERYKFLSQNSYEKKVFSDRQQKKASLRRTVSASWDGRSRHAGSRGGAGNPSGNGSEEPALGGMDTPRHSSLATDAMGDVTPLPKRTKPKNARFSLLDRLDPTKKRASRSKSSDAKLSGSNADRVASPACVVKAAASDVSNGRLKTKKVHDMKTACADETENVSDVRSIDVRGKRSSPQIRPTTSYLPSASSRTKTFQREFSASEISQDNTRTKSSMETRIGSAGASFTGSLKSPAPTTPTSNKSSSPHHRHHHRQHHHHHHRHHHGHPPDLHGQKQEVVATSATLDSNNENNSNDGVFPGASCRTTSATNRSDLPAGVRPDPKYGAPSGKSMTRDPRYARLEKTLCPLVRSKTSDDIGAIVNQIEALHVRPRKRPPDAKKTKIELKAFEYMKDKGFAF